MDDLGRSSEPVPPVVAQAQRDQARWLRTRLLPVMLWLLVSTIPGLLVAISYAPSQEWQMAAMGAWMLGVFVSLGVLTAGAARQQRWQEVIAEWNRRSVAREIAGHADEATADPLDALVERIVSLVDGEDRNAVIECRDRARALRADAARARAGAGVLPADGEGARALLEAADRAEREAASLDDRLGAIYAGLLAPSGAPEAAARVEARTEVERAARVRQTE